MIIGSNIGVATNICQIKKRKRSFEGMLKNVLYSFSDKVIRC